MNRLAAAWIGAWAICGAAGAPTDATAAPQPGDARGDQALNAVIMRQLYACWHPPSNATATAKIRFTLNRDGTLAGTPTLVKVNVGTRSQSVIDSAMRAVHECRLHLPPAKYEFWRDIEVNFDAVPN